MEKIRASRIRYAFILDTIERRIPPRTAVKIAVVSSAGLLREVIYRRLTRGSIREMGSLRESRTELPTWATSTVQKIVCPHCGSTDIAAHEGMTDFTPDPSHGSYVCKDCAHSWLYGPQENGRA